VGYHDAFGYLFGRGYAETVPCDVHAMRAGEGLVWYVPSMIILEHMKCITKNHTCE
jgi:hypothetical protein